MDSNARFKSSLGFIDLLFNILLGFAFLFIVAFLLIKPEAKKKDFDRRAEFVIILEWNHDAPDDLDLYVEDPTEGKTIRQQCVDALRHCRGSVPRCSAQYMRV